MNFWWDTFQNYVPDVQGWSVGVHIPPEWLAPLSWHFHSIISEQLGQGSQYIWFKTNRIQVMRQPSLAETLIWWTPLGNAEYHNGNGTIKMPYFKHTYNNKDAWLDFGQKLWDFKHFYPKNKVWCRYNVQAWFFPLTFNIPKAAMFWFKGNCIILQSPGHWFPVHWIHTKKYPVSRTDGGVSPPSKSNILPLHQSIRNLKIISGTMISIICVVVVKWGPPVSPATPFCGFAHLERATWA